MDEVNKQTLMIIFYEIEKNLKKAKQFHDITDIFIYIDFALSDVKKGMKLLSEQENKQTEK